MRWTTPHEGATLTSENRTSDRNSRMPKRELLPDWVPPGDAMKEAVASRYPGLTGDQAETTAGIVLGRVVKGVASGRNAGLFQGPFPDGSFEAEIVDIREVITEVLLHGPDQE